MLYRHFPYSASPGYYVMGPGLCTGDLEYNDEAEAKDMCRLLDLVFIAGKKARDEEIKQFLKA